MNYRPEIDGLRAIAVLPVILFHAGFASFSGGFVGVDVFFVISGYLITSIILSELEKGTFSMVDFYQRRARRLLPALFLVMLVSIPFAWFLLFPHDLLEYSQSLVSISAFVSNVFFWSERGYFGTATELKPLAHTWSLAVEEQYYLFFPWLLVFFARRDVLRNTLLFVLFIVSFGLCVWLTRVDQDSAFYLLPTRLWEMLTGSFVAIILFKGSGRRMIHNEWMRDALGVLGIALIAYGVMVFDKSTPFPGYAASLPVLGTALVIVFASERNLIGKLLSFKVFVFIGLWSYSAYLWHQPVFAFVRHANVELTSFVAAMLVLLTFVLSYASWRFVEQPWRKNPYSKSTVFTSALCGLVLFVALGFAGIQSKGFMDRYSKEDAAILESYIDAGDYLRDRFDKLKHAQFDMNDTLRKKVLIIGDSYGQDLVNAIYESSTDKNLQISTHHIRAQCGNLYLREEFSKEIYNNKISLCKDSDRYDNEKLKHLLRQADYIWLASSWLMWVAERLPMSIDNLEKDFGKPVYVFGRKYFGNVNLNSLISIKYEDRKKYYNNVDEWHTQINSYMNSSLYGYRFIDVNSRICGLEQNKCPLFNAESIPLSYDGGHLTRAGSKFMGEVLFLDPHPLLLDILE